MKQGLLTASVFCLAFIVGSFAHADQISDLQKRVSDLEAKMKKGDEKNLRKIESLKTDVK